MPIRINLIAEAQAAEDGRRRDPVKRAVWVGVFLVIMVLVWSSSLWVKILSESATLNRLEGKLHSKTNQYSHVQADLRKLDETHRKLVALNHLAVERYLEAPMLDAIQHTVVEGIQIMRLRTEQNCDVVAETKPIPGEHGKMTPGKPATSTEKIKLILDARDTSPNPGNEQISKFKESLADAPYFKEQKLTTNDLLLRNLSSPQLDNESGKPYVLFTLECHYHDRLRVQP